MPKPEEDLINRLTTRPEVREKARALLRVVHSKTGPGTGYDIGDAKSGLPAICAYLASKSAGYADVTQEVAQKASCLAPKTFVTTLRTVKTALLASSSSSPSKAGGGDEIVDPTAYATLVSKYKIGQPRRVEQWMKEAEAALVALPRFRHDLAPRLAESGVEVRIAVFYWVCRAIKLSSVQHIQLVDKYGVSSKDFNRLVKMMGDECVELKESISATIREMRKNKAAKTEPSSGAALASASKTPTGTPSHSRPASPTKSAMRGDASANWTTTTTTPSSSLMNSAKRKVAFSLSDIVSASEDDDGIFAPETPSKKRPRRASSSASSASSASSTAAAAAAATKRIMPVSKAQLASSVTSSSSEGDGEGGDVEMADAAVFSTPSRPKRRLVAVSASRASASPVAGPSTPRRPTATPTHAYRTPPSTRIQLLSRLSDDEDSVADVDDAEGVSEVDEDCDDDALPPSRRFRPVFLDRVQWAQRAPRLAHDRAAAEKRTRELVGRWGHPVELLRRASAEVSAS